MATYTCRQCGVTNNDTVNSQLNTSITFTTLEEETEVIFYGWEKYRRRIWCGVNWTFNTINLF